MITYEIERKFLVDSDPGIIMKKNHTVIYQNYFLSGRFIQGRVRREEDIIVNDLGEDRSTTQRLLLMFKIRLKKPIEIIVDLNFIPAFMYKRLKTFTMPLKSSCISKKRYFFGKWMLDVFITTGVITEGNQILEIELSKKNEPLPDFPEGMEVIKEVTDDKNYYNHNIYNKHAQ